VLALPLFLQGRDHSLAGIKPDQNQAKPSSTLTGWKRILSFVVYYSYITTSYEALLSTNHILKDLQEVPCFREFRRAASASNITSIHLTNAMSAPYQVRGETLWYCMPLDPSIIWINEGKELGHHEPSQHHVSCVPASFEEMKHITGREHKMMESLRLQPSFFPF
jgi:hypothetical protein